MRMAELNVLVDEPPEAVWAVLADGWSYVEWVVGTTEILDVEDGWPAEGTSIAYRAGAGPATFEGRTYSRICEPLARLELEAKAPRIGTARIAIQVLPWGGKSLIIIDEHPISGPGAWLHTAVLDVVLRLRNGVMLRRLGRLVERRGQPGPGR